MTAQAPYESRLDVDALAQEIRRVDGSHSLGAGALAEALAPYIDALPERAPVSAGGDADTRQMNDALIDFAKRWKVDGDYLRCTHCERPQIASRWREDFIHAAGCLREDSEAFPWLALARLVEPMTLATPAPPVGADWRIDDLETSLSVMIEWFDTVAEVAKWTRDNANAAFMARDACEETLNAAGPYAAPKPAEARGVGGGEWRIDTSAGGPILVYENCSVIESEQAEYVLRLIAADRTALAANKPAGEVES